MAEEQEGAAAEPQGLPQRPPRAARKRPRAAEPADAAAAPAAAAQGAQVAGAAGGGVDGGGGAAEPSAEERAAPAVAAAAAAASRPAAPRAVNYEYLDHTADVQLHAWGATLEEAFEGAGLALFNYMTPLEGVRVARARGGGDGGGGGGVDSGGGAGAGGGAAAAAPDEVRVYEASGHDMHSLLFSFLDELLFGFASDLFVAAELRVTALERAPAWRARAEGRGERFEPGRHAAGTEVKAITYSAMAVREEPGRADVWCIVDI